MAFFKQNSARHRAATASHAVRNTTIAAAAGAAVLGSVAPAQAYAEVPAASTGAGAVYATPASSSLAAQTSYTYEAPAATPAPAPAPAPAAPSAGLAVQSNDTVEIASTASSGGIVGTAMQGLGSGYVYGGTAFGAWDCSGFTQWVFAQQGVDLPRTTWSQFAASTPVASPQPGDLVSQNGGAHVGIYIGGGKMISALNPTQGTQIHSVNAMPVDGYYRVG
ncbi:C40 family peptidase [Kocuria flava]|uniref:C40 family peptidase n=1 Tax=Kocuria flava TaxID=446860 RepID=UPI003F1D2325